MVLILISSSIVYSQPDNVKRLRVFIDCNSPGCDMRFFRSEINIVDFLLDNQAADLHILVTALSTGAGGIRFQLIFFGQREFSSLRDTLSFSSEPNATEFEWRNGLLQHIKIGMIPFLSKAGYRQGIEINLKTKDSVTRKDTIQKDPWNAWVLRIGIDGNFGADANYKNSNFSVGGNANRITNKSKAGFGFYAGKNRSVFQYEENGQQQRFVVNNRNFWINQFFVKSINPHWSWAYELRYSQNTFSNIRGRAFGRVAVEYDVFPYDQANNKLLTFSYGLTGRRNNYFDSTIYNKTRENLFGHRATATLSLTQKWGVAYASMLYHHYFNDLKMFNAGIDVYASIRITGGLSVFVFSFGSLTRDQVFLVKGDASPEEVLARRRQLASGYNYMTSVGINYRFGSKLNNIVNPRFDRSGSGVDD